ncbi:MAG: cation:proton antiporter [Rhodobiaceae bacterium]|nr:cation:proton antiporter [Rhodobiaceae bacterium]|tara:strand:+ start:9024 stop:10484 length:1461 start_codon:yes stop_codon:yes gene_type:complete
MNQQIIYLLPILIPIFLAILIKITWEVQQLRYPILLSGPILALLSVYKIQENSEFFSFSINIFDIFPNIGISLGLEPISFVFIIMVNSLWLVATLYSYGYMRTNNEKRLGNFFSFFAIAIGCANGAALSSNLLTLFIFYELLTVSTYPLVTHKGDEQSKQSGRKYLLILLGTSLCFFLPAMGYVYFLSGNLDFVSGGLLTTTLSGMEVNNIAISILLVLFIFGISKAAVMPFHSWLPAAMVAPTPVSALLHAVAVVKVGVFSIIKVLVYIFGLDILLGLFTVDLMIYICGFTIITTSVIALKQDNLKKLLAYSTISQLSYVIIAILILTPSAIIAASMHLVAHAVSKITLFFAAGAIYSSTGYTKISEMDGIGKKLKVVSIAFTLGAMSLVGIPLLVGFTSKWYIVQSSVEVGQWFILLIITTSTLLNIGYFTPIIYKFFFKNELKEVSFKTLPRDISLSIIICCALMVILFLQPNLVMEVISYVK